MKRRDKREKYSPEMVKRLLLADKEAPVATFTNVEDMLKWLEAPDEADPSKAKP